MLVVFRIPGQTPRPAFGKAATDTPSNGPHVVLSNALHRAGIRDQRITTNTNKEDGWVGRRTK